MPLVDHAEAMRVDPASYSTDEAFQSFHEYISDFMRLHEDLVNIREEGDEVNIPHLELVVPAEERQLPLFFS